MREPLPNCRPQITERVQWQEIALHVSVGLYPDGRPGEVFVRGLKSGAHLDALLDDAAVLISRLLQHGDTIEDLKRSLGTGPSHHEPMTLLGTIIDAAERISTQINPAHST